MGSSAPGKAMPALENRVLPARIFLCSQAARPEDVKTTLLDWAVSDGWISTLVNVNTAIFVGLIALTAGFGAVQSMIFLALQLSVTVISTIILLFLQVRRQKNRPVNAVTSERLLNVSDFLLMAAWGFGAVLFLSPLDYHRSLLMIALLTAAGIGASALNARLLTTVVAGRLILFLPSIVYILLEQPPFRGLLICTLLFATAVSIGIGYAIHVQHLNEANLGLKLREASVKLEQQSFSLERSMLLERETQERLLRETKLREQFLHSINHDLNQPLSALSLYLNDLEGRKLPYDARRTLRAARHCLSSANSMIHSVSQLAWIGEHLPAPVLDAVAVNPLMRRIVADVRALAAERNVRVSLVESSLEVRADADFLERVLRNLIHNAIQYAHDGRVVIGARRSGTGSVAMIVADNGPGISTEYQTRIFEAFYQIDAHTNRRAGNIGLGLSIVKDLTDAMDGHVHLKSHINRGSVFTVVLPVAGNGEPANGFGQRRPPTPTLPDARSYRNRSVLLVEDQPEFLDSISEMLLKLGFDVFTAATPEELQRIDSNTLARHDYLLMDYDLGNGRNAFDILAPGGGTFLPSCLIISQYDNPDVILRTKENGGRFLKKPFSQHDLEIALRILERSRKGIGSATRQVAS